MEINDLKAKAYDCVANIRYYEDQLKQLNQMIAEQVRQSQESAKVEKKK
jgi:predicted fused transcriptional regulator/phosphomethylpyrimidine kinase